MNEQEKLNKHVSDLSKRLGVVISLLLRMVPREGQSINLKEQVELLSSFGVRPRDIAEILGRTSGYITKELAGLRKKKIKKENKKPDLKKGKI